MSWITKANQLGGAVGIVGFALWFYQGIYKGQAFRIGKRFDEITGVSRQTRQSALKKLQIAGLIEFVQKRGSYPTVRILSTQKRIPPGVAQKSSNLPSATARYKHFFANPQLIIGGNNGLPKNNRSS